MKKVKRWLRRAFEFVFRGKFCTIRCTWCGKARTIWIDNDGWWKCNTYRHCGGLGFYRVVEDTE